MTRTAEEMRIARRRLLLVSGGFIYLMVAVAVPPLLIGVPIAAVVYFLKRRTLRAYQAEQRRASQINRRGY